MIEAVRTSEQRFARLSGYPYPARWLALEDGELRLVYVSEGAHENRSAPLSSTRFTYFVGSHSAWRLMISRAFS